jgi:hypothetical protein
LDEADADNRLARSALELERGYELQAATREGLITESLQALQRDLDAAAQIARGESQEAKEENARPEQLLSELGELRRALQEGGQAAQEGGQTGGAAGSAGYGAPGGPQTGYGGHLGEGDRGRLNAWNPPLAGNAGHVESPQLQRDAQAIAQRLRDLRSRLPAGSLRAPDIAALKELSDRLRRSGSGDPMESQYARMLAIVDQLELATLSAADKANPQAPTRAVTPEADTPEYQANVAEYYRRLGAGGTAQK